MDSLEFQTTSGNLEYQISDHLIQFLLIHNFMFKGAPISKNKITQQDFKFFNDDEFKTDISNIDWDELICQTNVNFSFNELYNTLIYYLDQHAPLKELTKRQRSLKLKSWITGEILHKMNLPNCLLQKFKKAKDPSIKTKKSADYQFARNEVSKQNVLAKKRYYEEFFKTNQDNTSKIWQGIKSLVTFKNNNKSSPSSLLHNGISKST